MISVFSRTVSRATSASRGFQALCIPNRTTLGTLPQLGTNFTVRHLQIHRVGTKKTPSKERAAVPLRYVRHSAEPAGFENIDVDRWLSNIKLPPDTYWERWSPALAKRDKGGLFTAHNFVHHWQDVALKRTYRIREHGPSNGQRRIVECTGVANLPLLGLRSVVSYGYSKREASENQLPARISNLYESGELDTIYLGTIASRNLIAIYEQAARYGLHPRFKVSMSNDRPDAQFRITLAVPEWNILALATAPTYVQALGAVIETYTNQAQKHAIKRKFSREATKQRLELLTSGTARRALRFSLEKLGVTDHIVYHKRPDIQGPQYVYAISVDGKPTSARVPMLRKRNALQIAVITAVVRVLQRYGFATIDGFGTWLEATNKDSANPTTSREYEEDGTADQSDKGSLVQRKLDQVEQDGATAREESMTQLHDKYEALDYDDTAEEATEAQETAKESLRGYLRTNASSS